MSPACNARPVGPPNFPSVKEDLLKQLHRRWDNETHGNAIFVSATERSNIDLLRETILERVKRLYEERYPYLNTFY